MERLMMSWNDEQKAKELATRGSFGVLTTKCDAVVQANLCDIAI